MLVNIVPEHMPHKKPTIPLLYHCRTAPVHNLYRDLHLLPATTDLPHRKTFHSHRARTWIQLFALLQKLSIYPQHKPHTQLDLFVLLQKLSIYPQHKPHTQLGLFVLVQKLNMYHRHRPCTWQWKFYHCQNPSNVQRGKPCLFCFMFQTKKKEKKKRTSVQPLPGR